MSRAYKVNVSQYVNSAGDKNTVLDGSENQPQKKQINAILEQTFDINRTKLVERDTHSWYCDLRTVDHDHEYDGVYQIKKTSARGRRGPSGSG